MYLLGAHLPDQKLVRIALTSFYGISHATARRMCARLQLHEAATVSSLNESQISMLSAYLSSPASIQAQQPAEASPVIGASVSNSALSAVKEAPSQFKVPAHDPLRSLVLETDLKRQVQGNIAHHRNIGTYRGRRHLQGLPVRGQKTRTNAQTARKLNRGGRGMSTWARSKRSEEAPPSVMALIEPLCKIRFPS